MNFTKTILKNGLRLVIVPMKDNPTVTVMVLVEAGSKYEQKKISGISHFLEHMCFKGTTKRPKAVDIVKELDSYGCQYNAFTSQEMTGYYAKSDQRHFGKILDVVSDIYLHSTFPKAELEKEKGVIVEEIRMYQDMPPRHIHDVLMGLLYDGQPAGWDVAGTEETVRSTTRERMLAYRSKHYVSGATTVVVAGNVDEKDVAERVGKAFAEMPSGKKHPKTAVTEAQKKPAIAMKFKETDQVHLALALRTFDLYHEDMPAMRVASTVLGGSMSSRLFQKMRDELGICYYISAAHETFTDHGFLEITAGVPAKRLTEALSAIMEELRLLKREPVSAEELARVKEYLIGNMHLGLESSDSLAEFYGYQEIVRKPLQLPSAVAEKIRKVTSEDVARVVKKYVVESGLNLAFIGPVKSKKELETLLQV
ncbi:MAG: Peptidase M16 domain protein [Parcubacteria group bacterium GW2011_GWA2_49_9]|nr:MAG: Peptidase M16 domain protein [Parcubacteria group bacterium GW2011_GWA2_49_9]